ncbi:LLM class flavin-dependent oxidoreductase [Ktedonosporobacter rubrisoli]|uniref:LLM class flavin-dependent oxidoreductase n=1 Tax=Ktedonosporobacter rubrisoli TaxID=2509675 RepID=A0A4P6JLX3_KTERU|nr:LLM class flavin-dependent oxidoreductase [Ktedonosporobacter rubrisoli]QBD76239.1 LLM class flavin-dependent oxidoreductase [Ktedonosporobacter rubrisoli]
MTMKFPIGVTIFSPSAQQTLTMIKQVEQLGIPRVWIPSWPVGLDGLAIVTAAAVQTSQIGLGTAITITYPRHPLTLANEALVAAELAPQRFRLGIGASHRPAIEGNYGLDFMPPLARLREYITVLRGMLWEGRSDFEGEYYRVHAQYSAPPPRTPIALAAMRKNMLRLAGELADEAIVIWSPLSYLKSVVLPALEEGAKLAGRPRPKLIASAPIVLDKDFATVRQIAQNGFSVYRSFPTYRRLLAEAGFSLTADGKLPDEFIHDHYIYGDPDTIRQRLYALHAAGVDEIITGVGTRKDPARDTNAILELLASL